MKKNRIFLSLIILGTAVTLKAQQNYLSSMTGDSEDNFGDDLFERAEDISTGESQGYDNSYGQDPKVKSPGSSLSDYLKRSVENMKLERKKSLLKQANRQLNHEIQRRKFQERLDQRNHHYEKVIAEAWVISRTGKRDGRLWHELMPDEQDTYRERYMNYLYPDGENQLEDFPEKDNFFIPENEYAMAWNKRNKDTKAFRPWNGLSVSERSDFRRGFRHHKIGMYYLAKSMEVMPDLQLSEREMEFALATK